MTLKSSASASAGLRQWLREAQFRPGAGGVFVDTPERQTSPTMLRRWPLPLGAAHPLAPWSGPRLTLSPAAKLAVTALLMAPVTVLGLVLGALLPRNGDMFLDQLVVARRP